MLVPAKTARPDQPIHFNGLPLRLSVVLVFESPPGLLTYRLNISMIMDQRLRASHCHLAVMATWPCRTTIGKQGVSVCEGWGRVGRLWQWGGPGGGAGKTPGQGPVSLGAIPG